MEWKIKKLLFDVLWKVCKKNDYHSRKRTISTPSDGPPQQSTYIILKPILTSTDLDDKKTKIFPSIQIEKS